MNNKILIVIVVVLVIGAVFVMGANLIKPSPSDLKSVISQPTSSSVITQAVANQDQEVKEFVVTGSSFKFAPSEIQIKRGDTVRIIFKNAAGFHDFTIDELNAKTKQIKSGDTDTIEFVAEKTGTYEYYCSVGNHRQMGMVGNLVVE